MVLAGVIVAVLVVVAIVVIGLIMYFVGIYNTLVTLKNDIDRSFANIDVLLKQRHDELVQHRQRPGCACLQYHG